MMPSFHGSAQDAAEAGYTVKPCAHCNGWAWVKADRDPSRRVWCTSKQCERAEGVMQASENPRPTYKAFGRMGIDLGTFAIDEFDASFADKIETIRSLEWLAIAQFDNHISVMRVS